MNGRRRKSYIQMTLLIIYTGLVFYLSLKPVSTTNPVMTLPGWDKIAHAAEFALMYVILKSTFDNTTLSGRGAVAMAFFTALMLSSATEGSQLAVTYRTASIFDWLANIGGITIGWFSTATFDRLKST